MYRTIIHLLVASLVWLSADAAADSGTFGHAHQGAPVQMEDPGAPIDAAGETQRRHDDGGHCERCCHANASVLPSLSLASDNVHQRSYPRPADLVRPSGNPPPPIPPPIA